jgi:hypothetical protein
MNDTLFADVHAAAITAFHDATMTMPGWSKQPPSAARSGAWQWIEANHRHNCLLWDEEDRARRRDVADAEIAANKRAIDRYNQLRNDAVECIDEALLARLEDIAPREDAWHHSETAGAMIDRLSILALKLHHMHLAATSSDVDATERRRCEDKCARLALQRADLARCLDTLLAKASTGQAFWRVYRQFKMYNDPKLNPWLRRQRSGDR